MDFIFNHNCKTRPLTRRFDITYYSRKQSMGGGEHDWVGEQED